MKFHVRSISDPGRNWRLRLGRVSGESRRHSRRLQIECLESRCLLSVTINEFPLNPNSQPIGITAGPDGNLWFTEFLGNQVGEINPTTHAIAEFPIPAAGSEPLGITAGPDGNLWFTELAGGKIGEINPTTDVITEFPLPTANSEPSSITAGPDGNLWFTDGAGNKIGQINPTSHAIAEFPLRTASSEPSSITAGPDGNLWFTEDNANNIGQINPTSHAIAEFPIPKTTSVGVGSTTDPVEITLGPDGNLWFTEAFGEIGHINPTTHAIAVILVTTNQASPKGITAGPDGNLWFTEPIGAIGEINPTTLGVATFPVPTSGGAPQEIVAGPDGNLWFAEQGGGKIAEVVLKAPATTPDLALSGTAPTSVTVGTNVTYALTVTNNGTATATGVTVTDTLPSGVTFDSATGGVTPVAGALNFSIGSLAAGASTSVSIVVTRTSAGALNDSATASMTQTDPTPADDRVTLATMVSASPPVVGAPPTVTGVQRFGFHVQPTTLVLTFDEQLDPIRAENASNYQIIALEGSRRSIRIKSAVYDAATRTVTLRPAHRLNLHNRFRLTVVGTEPRGLSDTFGNLLDGQGNGDPGSDFVTIVTAADLVLTSTDPAIIRAYKKLLLDQSEHRGAVPFYHWS
jgi:uncharacterized repeat protein (TIGR01451 family)